jgi:hypothetical protein
MKLISLFAVLTVVLIRGAYSGDMLSIVITGPVSIDETTVTRPNWPCQQPLGKEGPTLSIRETFEVSSFSIRNPGPATDCPSVAGQSHCLSEFKSGTYSGFLNLGGDRFDAEFPPHLPYKMDE